MDCFKTCLYHNM